MEENEKETSIAAATTIEVESLLLDGKITLNQARELLGLNPSSEPLANELLIKRDEKSS